MPIPTRMKTYGVILGLLLGVQAGGVYAADTQDKTLEGAEPSMFVGGGALFTSVPYRGVSTRGYPVPLCGYEGERLYLRGLTGGYPLFKSDGWSIGPVLKPRLEGYRSDDSSALRGMETRSFSIDAGVGVQAVTSVGMFSLSWVTDILGRQRGFETEFAYTLWFPWKGFDFIPSVGVRCKSGDLANYYYGVKDDETLSDRPFYKAGSAIDPFVRVAVKRELIGDFSFLGALEYEWLDSAIRDSPIVDRSYNASFVLGLLYTF